MAESSSQGAQQRRANWVGLRTLRQRPRLVDQTAGGLAVYDARSVRLVLVGDATHFNRLMPCSKCGKEVPGPPVLSATDLDRPSHPVICKECVRASGVSQVGHTSGPAAPSPLPEPPPEVEVVIAPETPAPQPEVAEVEPGQEPDTLPVADEARLAAIEDQLGVALLRITEVADVQRLESIRRAKGDEGVQAQVQAALVQALAELRAEVLASAEATATRLAALEEGVRAAVAETRAELARVSTSTEDLAARVSAQAANTASALEAVQARFGSVEGAMDERVQQGIGAVAPLVDHLTRAGDRVAAEVDRLGYQVAATEGRIDALTSSVDMGASRLRALEQRLQESVQRLAAEVKAQRGVRPGPPATPSTAPGEEATDEGTGSADLMHALERQLRKAESRLAGLEDLR